MNERQMLQQEILLLQQKVHENEQKNEKGNIIIEDGAENKGRIYNKNIGNINSGNKEKNGELKNNSLNNRTIKIKLGNKK